MNKNLTAIAYILDRSGSMQSMVEPAIAGFNRFLDDQRKAPGHARLTLVLFDDQYEVPCQSLPIEEVTELDTTTYVPRGTTALLDAIGRTIEELGQRLAATPEPERPGQVIVAIFTDGLENASLQFDHHKIARMIAHQRDHRVRRPLPDPGRLRRPAGAPEFAGRSLRPVLDDPGHPGKQAAFSQVNRGQAVGRSVRTQRWRYTEWGPRGQPGSELYDHEQDQGEYYNLADLPDHAAARERLAKLLATGFSAAERKQ